MILRGIVDVNYNSKVFRFCLPDEEPVGLPIGQHVQLEASIGGKLIKRSYTPVSDENDEGFIDILIKVYPPTKEHPRGGLMSQYVFDMKLGDRITVTGPRGKLQYKGQGRFRLRERKETGSFDTKKRVNHIGMICGGTGFAPMLQIIRSIVDNPNDKTNVTLLFANRAEVDILCREFLDEVAKNHSRIKVVYCLSQSGETWSGERGWIDGSMIRRWMPKPSKSVYILLCGSSAMVNKSYVPNLKCYDQTQVFVY